MSNDDNTYFENEYEFKKKIDNEDNEVYLLKKINKHPYDNIKDDDKIQILIDKENNHISIGTFKKKENNNYKLNNGIFIDENKNVFYQNDGNTNGSWKKWIWNDGGLSNFIELLENIDNNTHLGFVDKNRKERLKIALGNIYEDKARKITC